MTFLIRRRQDDDDDATPPVSPRKYRQAQKSGVVHLGAIDEDFTIPPRRLRAAPISSNSFREVSRGLGAANRAMSQLSRVGRQSQFEQARRTRNNLEPNFDSLSFDDWMETLVSIELSPSGHF